MNQEFHLDSSDKTPVANFTICVSNVEYECNRTIAVNSSKLIFEIFSKEKSKKSITLNFSDDFHQFYLIEKLFMGESILFCKENVNFLIEVSEYLQITSLTEKSIEFQEYLEDLNELIENDESIQNIIELENEIFNLKEKSFELIIELIEKLNSTKAVCQLIINACFSRQKLIPIYLKLITQITQNDNSFIEVFLNTMLDPYVAECKTTNEYVELRKEVEFILRWLIDHKLIEFDEIIKNGLKFYSFYLIDFLEKKNPKIIEIMSEIYKDLYQTFFQNLEEIKKNDWEIHKKLVQEGMNNYEIAIAIQNDDKDKLQQIVAQPKYNNVELCKVEVPSSVYERCTFIDRKQTLIQYSAFFGSINCFKFLIMNDPKFAPNNFQVIENQDEQNKQDEQDNDKKLNPFRNDPNYVNLAKYAVASGNPEIIHIIEQKGCSFDDTLKFAFDYAHHDIFDWIRMNKYENSKQLPLSSFLTKCVHQMQISLMIEMLEDGMNPNESKLITAAVEEENIILLDFLLKIKGIEVNENNIIFFNFNQIRHNMQEIVDIQQMVSSSSNNLDPPLITACIRRKKEIVERLLNFPSTDVNIRGRNYKTALATVALNGDVEIAKMLLNHDDIIINIFEEKRKTPFYVACENNNFEIVKLLAARNETDINEHTREDEKLTPLHISILNGNEQISSFLLGLKDIDVNAQTKEGKTPLHQASQRRKNINIIKLLLNHKDINLNVFTLDHLSPLHYACGKSSLEIVKLLYETGQYDINCHCDEILYFLNF